MRFFLMRWRYMIAGMLIGAVVAALVVLFVFTLPVSAPVIGGAIAAMLAFSAAVGSVGTAMVIAGSVLLSAVIGGMLGQWVGELIKNLFKQRREKPLSSQALIVAELRFSRMSSSVNDFNNQNETGFLIEILHELESVDLKAQGWARKISELRARLLSGKEKNVLQALHAHGDRVLDALVKRLESPDCTADELEVVLEKGLVKKLRVMFHPDKSDSPLAAEISKFIEGWWDKTQQLLRSKMSEQVFADMMRKMDEGIQKVREELKRLDAGIARLDAGIVRVQAGIGRLDEGIARLDDGIERVDIGLAQLDAGISEVKLKMDKLQTTVMLSLFPTLLNNDQPQAAIQAKRGSQEITNIPPSQATVENKEQALLAHSSGR